MSHEEYNFLHASSGYNIHGPIQFKFDDAVLNTSTMSKTMDTKVE